MANATTMDMITVTTRICTTKRCDARSIAEVNHFVNSSRLAATQAIAFSMGSALVEAASRSNIPVNSSTRIVLARRQGSNHRNRLHAAGIAESEMSFCVSTLVAISPAWSTACGSTVSISAVSARWRFRPLEAQTDATVCTKMVTRRLTASITTVIAIAMSKYWSVTIVKGYHNGPRPISRFWSFGEEALPG